VSTSNKQLKILSWNIWIDGHFDQITEFIKRADADIVGLQEVKDDDSSRDTIGFMTGLGYQYVFGPVKKGRVGKMKNDGPAIFSKYPIRDSHIFNLSDVYNRVAVRADIEVGEKVIHVFCTHLLHTHQKQSEAQEIQVDNLIKVLPTEQTIVMGDFNATPEMYSINSMRKVLIDTDPNSNPTWSVYPEGCDGCNPRAIETRLDYIFVSKDIRFNSFKVESSKGSDHLPISVAVEI
jgi:endonuclease/exonuclease/phosphatase family metal-dependent hydrolase